MAEWSSGYNVDTGYTYGFYKELAPSWLNYVATLQGITAPFGNKLRYLELGCGYGLGLILLAAVHPEYDFVGIDFNPVHVAHGRKLAAEAGLKNIQFEEADFLDLAEDWPLEWGRFDYVSAHGIYTWLDFPVRDALVKTINHASAPGALIYLSYNTMPGWISIQPVQHLIRLWEKTEHMSSAFATAEGVKRLNALVDAKAIMTLALPNIKSRLETMDSQDPIYLAHEYLNGGWQPVWFNQMADALDVAKLSYVGTANVGDFVLESVLQQAQKDILAQYDDPIVRQVILDVLVNQNFRKDVYSRGAPQMWGAVKQKAMLDMVFVLARRPEVNAFKFKLSLGEVTSHDEIYKLCVDALENGQKSVSELLAITGKPLKEIISSMTMLMHAGYVTLYKPLGNRKAAKALNRVIIENVANGAPYRYLIASEIGSVFGATEVNLIMAHEVLNGTSVKEPAKLAEKLLKNLSDRGKSLVKDGQALPTHDAKLLHASTLAETFLSTILDKWKMLGVI